MTSRELIQRCVVAATQRQDTTDILTGCLLAMYDLARLQDWGPNELLSFLATNAVTSDEQSFYDFAEDVMSAIQNNSRREWN